MVARSYLLSLLAIVATLGTNVFALPQEDESATPPVGDLGSADVEFAATDAASAPVPGAESNALLAAAPVLEQIANEGQDVGTGVSKRDLGGLEKRAVCGKPGAHKVVWHYFAQKFCNHFFPNPKAAYYLQEGRCVSGSVKVKRPWIAYRLNYRCCAKKCGAHVSFVGVTQAVCKAHFRKAIIYGDRQCPRRWIRSSDNARDSRDPMVCSFWAS